MVSRSPSVISRTRGSASAGTRSPSSAATGRATAASIPPGITPRSIAMPVSVATMVFDTDLTLTGRSTGGPRNVSATAISPPRATIRLCNWSSPAACSTARRISPGSSTVPVFVPCAAAGPAPRGTVPASPAAASDPRTPRRPSSRRPTGREGATVHMGQEMGRRRAAASGAGPPRAPLAGTAPAICRDRRRRAGRRRRTGRPARSRSPAPPAASARGRAPPR